jgi:hypothetical protein
MDPSGIKFILCITDVFLKYVELVAITDKSSSTVGSALFSRLLCRHGLPLGIVLDNGKEFCNEVVDTLLKLMRIKKTNKTLYNPQTNAQAKICNKTFASYSKILVLSSTLDCEHYIAPISQIYQNNI